MSIFDKVKEMLGGTNEKLRDIPEQGKNAGDTAQDKAQEAGGTLDGLREKAEDAAHGGIDSAAERAKRATGGKFDEHIDKGTDMAKGAADKIDGKEG
ncbi:antitoxin [Nonomuraea sp. NBC_01738]|uniref:antitoxin n=1 Tax=Nonomuraea sp. NBC_01738 TaxID=2976003 RepID=UPI002E0FB7E1|nr:antitoxin [Nonomuraea sp. NBC_01738]